MTAKPDTPAFTRTVTLAQLPEQANLLPDGTLVTCAGFVDTILQDRSRPSVRRPVEGLTRPSCVGWRT